MDNQTIDVTSEGTDGIGHALAIIWNAAAPGGRATHYKVANYRSERKYHCIDRNGSHHTSHSDSLVVDEKGVPTLILLWHEEQGATQLPFRLDQYQAATFICDWLKQIDYGIQPDHDGSNGRGWRIFTESWGHVAGHQYAIVGVQPEWAMYGK